MASDHVIGSLSQMLKWPRRTQGSAREPQRKKRAVHIPEAGQISVTVCPLFLNSHIPNSQNNAVVAVISTANNRSFLIGGQHDIGRGDTQQLAII